MSGLNEGQKFRRALKNMKCEDYSHKYEETVWPHLREAVKAILHQESTMLPSSSTSGVFDVHNQDEKTAKWIMMKFDKLYSMAYNCVLRKHSERLCSDLMGQVDQILMQ